jgi:hypothetical protein
MRVLRLVSKFHSSTQHRYDCSFVYCNHHIFRYGTVLQSIMNQVVAIINLLNLHSCYILRKYNFYITVVPKYINLAT